MKGLGRNNLLKRVSAFILALLMVFTMMPVSTSVMKAEDGETSGDGSAGEGTVSVSYTFDVYELIDSTETAIGEATVSVYAAGYDGTDAAATKIATGTTGIEGDTLGKVSLELVGYEAETAKDLVYEVTYTKVVAGEDGSEDTSIVYVTERGTLGNTPETTIKVEMKQAVGVSGTICLGDTSTIATESFEVYFMNGETKIASATSRNGGTYEIIMPDDFSYDENVTYTVKVQSTEYTPNSCVVTVINFAGDKGVIVAQNNIVLAAKEKSATLIFEYPTPEALEVGGTFTNTLTCMDGDVDVSTDTNAVIDYKSSNNDVVSVDENGQVTAVAPGTATITASFYSDTYKLSTASYTVTVKGFTYSGVVKDDSGNPINSANVYLVSESDDLSNLEITKLVKETTGADGTYSLTYNAYGNYKIVVNCGGYNPVTESITVPSDGAAYIPVAKDFELELITYSVSGIVKTSENPVSGVDVYLVDEIYGSIDSIDLSTLEDVAITDAVATDENGQYTINKVVPGEYSLVYKSENYVTGLKVVTVEDSDVTDADCSLESKQIAKIVFNDSTILLNGAASQTILNYEITNSEGSDMTSDISEFTFTYTMNDNDAITIKSSDCTLYEIKALGTATIHVDVFSHTYLLDETSDLSFDVNVLELAFDNTEVINSDELNLKYKDDYKFSTKVVLVDKDGNKNDVDLSEVTFSSTNDKVAKIEVVKETVEESEVITDVNVVITGVSNDTDNDETNNVPTISAEYKGLVISYTINVAKGELPKLEWNTIELNAINAAANYTVENVVVNEETGETVIEISTTYKKDMEGFTLTASTDGTPPIICVYYSSNTNVATVENVISEGTEGKVNIVGAGTTTIECSTVSDLYEDKEITYILKVEPAEQNITWKPIDWTPADFVVLDGGEVTIEYKAGLQYQIGVDGQTEDTNLSYGFALEEIEGYSNVATLEDQLSGIVNVHNVGEVNVVYHSKDTQEAIDAEINRYDDVTISYKLVVVPGEENLAWNVDNMAALDQIAILTNAENTEVSTLPTTGGTATIVYAENGINFTLGATGGNEDLDYSFSVSGNDGVITLDAETGEVTVNKAGTVTITYKATNSTNNYEQTELNYTLVVAKADQDGFVWADDTVEGSVQTVTYDAAETPVIPLGLKDVNAIKESSEANLQYSIEITEGNANAIEINSTTGEVTIHESAKATITAKLVATTNYNAKTITYQLVVNKADDSITFNADSLTITNGQLSYVLPVIADDNDGVGTGAITYSISNNNGVATIDSETGVVTFGLQPGTVTVTATKAADTQYSAATDTYVITVNEWNPLANGSASNYYTISGTKIDSTSAWYTTVDGSHPIRLTAKTGYQLYKGTTDPVASTQWSSYVDVSDIHDGTNNSIVYYIKETSTGYVSKQYVINNFCVDTVAPSAAIAVDEATIWEKILSIFTFDLAGQDTPELYITSGDATSGVKAVYYYISSGVVPMTKNGSLDAETLESVATWKKYSGTVDLLNENVTENVIYTKVIDNAGNVTYAHTNGLIFDGAEPVVTPTVVTKDSNGIYYGNVEINLDIVDAAPYSGIQQITYVVENGSTVTESGTLFTFQPAEVGNPKQSELISAWNSANYGKNVVVKAADNNSDNVKVTFTVTDNAGNTTETVVNLMIDITAPVVSVQYDNNNGDATFANGVYYNANRTATITVKERHFDENNVKLTIKNTDGVIPSLSGWTKTSNGTGNGDDTTYQATVVFAADGDYTFDFSCVDSASNASGAVNYGTSQAPTAFTIDKTAPSVSVSYNNNDALNENYYKADRTATIVIQEHNFDASRVNVMITATDDGQTVAVPSISGWSSSGDTHIATIIYSSDALYTFDIEYADKAGNTIADFAPQTFYVDKTTPSVSITEIVDLSANNAEKIGFVITATDTNFDVFTPVLTAVIQTENGFTTTELDVASISEITNGRVYTVDNLEADGIYSITCTVIDKAGNAYTEVNLQRADGSTYVESRAGEDTLIMFSVNRDGSVFDVDDNTMDILNRYYVQNVENDIVIYEVNTNELSTYSISLNGEELVEGTDYTITSTGGNGEWMRYTYTVNKSLFENEGEYVLVVSSTDGAENNAFSDVKNANISFVVDRTAPVVTITGMESNRSYQTDRQTVTLMPTDDGGIIETLTVYTVDRDGNVEEELLNMSGDELRETLDANGGTVSFELTEGINQNVQIICSDGAYNAAGEANTFNQTYENITVSASAVALFFAGNTLLYIGGGVGVTAVVAGGGIFFFRRRKMPKAKN